MSLSTVILNFFKSQCDFFSFLSRWICAVSVTSHSHIWPSRLRKDARTKLRPQLSQVRLETQSQFQPLLLIASSPPPKYTHVHAMSTPCWFVFLLPRDQWCHLFFLIRKIKRRARTCILCEHRALCEVCRNDVKHRLTSFLRHQTKYPHCILTVSLIRNINTDAHVGITQSQRREALPWKPHYHGSYSRNWSPFWIQSRFFVCGVQLSFGAKMSGAGVQCPAWS